MLTLAVWLRMTLNSCPHCMHSWHDSLVPPHLVSVIHAPSLSGDFVGLQVWNLKCRLGCPQTHRDLPTSTSWVLVFESVSHHARIALPFFQFLSDILPSKIAYFALCIWRRCLYMSLCTRYMPSALRLEESVEFPGTAAMVVNHYMDAGNWTQVQGH